MKLNTNYRRLWTTALFSSALSLGAFGCAGSGEPVEIDEATAYITAAEEGDDVGGDAVVGMGEDAIEGMAGESSEAETAPGDAGSFEPCDFEARRARVKDHFDVNEDGRLDADERQALRDEITSRDFRRPRLMRLLRNNRHFVFKRMKWVFDTDLDGSLSQAERDNLVSTLQSRCLARRAAVLERFDVDEDGTLSEDELAAARAARRAALQAKKQALLDRYDADESGTLDRAERQQIKQDLRAAYQAKKAEVRENADTDGDGELSDAELIALKERIQERLANGPSNPGS